MYILGSHAGALSAKEKWSKVPHTIIITVMGAY